VEGVGWTPAPGAFQHGALASLAVFGFQFEGYLVRFIRHVMAVILEQVFLYGRVACQGWKDEVPSRFRYPMTRSRDRR
jgi:hypothetical protein